MKTAIGEMYVKEKIKNVKEMIEFNVNSIKSSEVNIKNKIQHNEVLNSQLQDLELELVKE